MKKRKKKKQKIIELKKRFNPATAKYEPVLPLKKGKSKFKLRFSWKAVLILVLLVFFLYALFSGWLNFWELGESSEGALELLKP